MELRGESLKKLKSRYSGKKWVENLEGAEVIVFENGMMKFNRVENSVL